MEVNGSLISYMTVTVSVDNIYNQCTHTSCHRDLLLCKCIEITFGTVISITYHTYRDTTAKLIDDQGDKSFLSHCL